MADDAESIETMRNHGDVAPDRLALVDEAELIAAVRSLISEGLAEALVVDDESHQLAVVESPHLDDESLRGYWFRPTAAGEVVWRAGEAELGAHYGR